MTQSIVNFLVDHDPGVGLGNVDFALDPRIFDFEISIDAKEFYESQINIINNALDDISNSGITNALAKEISDALTNLSEWSKLRSIQDAGPGGIATQTYFWLGPTNTDPYTFLEVNENGVPIDGPGGNPLFITNPDYNPALPDGPDNSPTIPPPPAFKALDGTILNSTMNRYMGEELDKLLRAFRSAGWDPVSNPYDDVIDPLPTYVTDALNGLVGPSAQSYGVFGANGILARALHAAGQARLIEDATSQSDSLQEVLMVDYISRGNELLFNEMSKLRDAIDINQLTLSYLNSLQDLMNQKDPEKFIMQLENLNDVQISSGQTLQDKFNTFERESYNEALETISKFDTDGDLETYLNSIAQGGTATFNPDNPLAVGSFEELADATSTMIEYSADRIIENLEYLQGQIVALGGSSGSPLSLALNRIKNDIESLQTDPNPLKLWVQDIQGKGETGDYQRNLNDAITSSQSFNDTQREELRRVMFVFEEFYKSATAILSRLTQLLEKMAVAISR